MSNVQLCPLCTVQMDKLESCWSCQRVFCRHLWRSGHCTNAVCLDCHRKHCSPGGETSPGHVYQKGTI